jgi:hypothetical protein
MVALLIGRSINGSFVQRGSMGYLCLLHRFAICSPWVPAGQTELD